MNVQRDLRTRRGQRRIYRHRNRHFIADAMDVHHHRIRMFFEQRPTQMRNHEEYRIVCAAGSLLTRCAVDEPKFQATTPATSPVFSASKPDNATKFPTIAMFISPRSTPPAKSTCLLARLKNSPRPRPPSV